MATPMEPERTLDTESIFEGKIIRVRVDTVGLPGGRQTTREVVEHRPAVVIVPIDSNERLLLVRQFRYPIGQALLEAPAGLVEEKESPDECAQRELQEEVGHLSRDLRALGGFWSSPGFSTEFIYAYLAKDLIPSKLKADADENILIEKFPVSSISKLIRLGEIQDAKTIAALLMAAYLFD
jgi:ADP-ribose pyrophosphatase